MRLFIATAILAFAALLSPASAHDYVSDNGEYENYGGWNRPDGKGGCCNNTDCEPIKAGQYMIIDGTYYVLIDGNWIKVDPKAYLEGTTQSELAHACWARKWALNIWTRKSEKRNPENPVIHCFKRPGGVGFHTPSPARVVPTTHTHH